MGVDDAGQRDHAAGVDHLSAGRVDGWPDALDGAVLDQDVGCNEIPQGLVHGDGLCSANDNSVRHDPASPAVAAGSLSQCVARRLWFVAEDRMRKVWIEVALNGAWSRKLQPEIPDTLDAIIEEGVACARAGASIIHTHAYEDGGRQTFDWQVYARIIEGIRAKVDVPVYPSYPGVRADKIEAAAGAR